jgi:hypothetical protein
LKKSFKEDRICSSQSELEKDGKSFYLKENNNQVDSKERLGKERSEWVVVVVLVVGCRSMCTKQRLEMKNFSTAASN